MSDLRSPQAMVDRLAQLQRLWQSGDAGGAEAELIPLLSAQPGHLPTARLLAQIRRSQGRLLGATAAFAGIDARTLPPDQVVDVAQFMKQSQQEGAALAFCERHLQATRSADVHAQAGMLALSLGRFDAAREHLLRALESGVDLNRWFVLQGLASCQRYTAADHPDIPRFREAVSAGSLQPRARASALFALGKALDEAGDVADAVAAYRQGNALLHALQPWQRSPWEAFVQQRLAGSTPMPALTPDPDFCPVFVVGLPRTGTTLVAEFLSRHDAVCNRGELPFVDFIARTIRSTPASALPTALAQGRALYRAHVVQDEPARRWYVDKNPLNFRHLDVLAALFPQARVIYCRRDPRDTAISLWTQFFAHDDYAFSNCLEDIAVFESGCRRLMDGWLARPALPTRVIDYETLVERPDDIRHALSQWVGVTPLADAAAAAGGDRAIQSASLWQARQPVYRHSVERWRRYAAFLPELSLFDR
ncbi:tetratricopeptide repeat-containing sulfotransferase family protein [Tahibacter amnicola]|uniref:Sulfotransferase n=1 Tax=Tahibacter amnicola TaxID=2976241 RepID=A0ABY6BEU0_9GAMM|nr:sulfotransferase [Tahibacter amnicola]UXI67625.1 sulfotransferase [Tahibacter amnicola]